MLAERIKTLISFLSPKVAGLFIGCIVLSLSIYLAETAFAYSILLFLIKLGFAKDAIPKAFMFFGEITSGQSVAILIAAALFRGVNWWLLQYAIGAVLETFRYTQRKRITRALMDGRLSSTSESIALYGEKTNDASTMIVAAQTTLVHSVLAVAYVATLFYLSFKATLIAAGALAVVLIPVAILYKVVRRSGDFIRLEWTKINRQLLLAFDNIFFLNISGMVPKTKKDAEESLSNYLSHFLTYHKVAAIVLVTPQIAGIIILVIVAHFATQGGFLQKALLVPYFYLFLRFIQAGAQASSRMSEVSFKWPQINELFHWWQKHKTHHENTDSDEREIQVSFEGPIHFKISDIDFSYENGEKVFSNFSMDIPPGSAAVVTGRSGTGKSTMLSLVLGMLEPHSGRVAVVKGSEYLDTFSVRKSLWDEIGYVGADSYMIAGTVEENLLFGTKHEISDEFLQQCLKLADCEFVNKLTGGLKYSVGEGGAGLSTGQRQRLGLARALLRKPKALILDEFTANLDEVSQDHLIETLSEFKGKVTMLIVTHRKELLKLADQHIELGKRRVDYLKVADGN